MIKMLEREEEAFLFRIAQDSPCAGSRIEIHWRMAEFNPAFGYQFYRVSDACLMELNGKTAFLCGQPKRPEELEGFLAFAGIERLTSDGWSPAGWHASPMCVMRHQPEPEQQESSLPPGFDVHPSMWEVIDVLESTDGRIIPEEARNGFYSDVCSRRNYGFAVVAGVRENSRLVSTAGIYCSAPGYGYIACVETIKKARGKGYATALVQWLCRRQKGPVYLSCSEDLVPFYRRIGFKEQQGIGYVASRIGGGAG